MGAGQLADPGGVWFRTHGRILDLVLQYDGKVRSTSAGADARLPQHGAHALLVDQDTEDDGGAAEAVKPARQQKDQ